MKTLITGGAGFIGAELAKMLAERGEGPIIISHRTGSNLDRIMDLMTSGKVETCLMDLNDPAEVERVVLELKPERIFHFGAVLSGPGEEDPAGLLNANVVGFIKIIEAARVVGTKQFIFASSIGTYGRDIDQTEIDDMSLQRPNIVYGVSKVFGENLGAYYKHKYGMDYRGLRYPSIIGPGVTTMSFVQYTSWMIEHPALGKPFKVWVRPEATTPVLYYKDAARAAIDLMDAPLEKIKAINYLVDAKNGYKNTPSAGQMADIIRSKIPGAQITFDEDAAGPPRNIRINDWVAREEWGWSPQLDYPGMVDAMIAEVAETKAM
ncbi:hypothetical protein DFJ74DRAFT_645323 [Hyaloraphidium curvatum]|nr:hypothetical protein DFJ74DRAFT_645323 [Hyaloraphidium curvatum]